MGATATKSIWPAFDSDSLRTPGCSTAVGKNGLHFAPAHPVMGQGDLHVEQDVGGLAGNVIGVVVLAGHHELGAFFADLLENAIVATFKQLVGVAPFFRCVATTFNHPHQLCTRIRGGWKCVFAAFGALVLLLEEAAACTGVTGHITALFDGEQEYVSIAVVTKSAQHLDMPAGGPLVPKLLSRSTPVVDFFGAEGVFQCLAVHPGHHQHGSVQPVLSDGGYQSGLVEAELIDEGRGGGLH